jgi:hypothetical protein
MSLLNDVEESAMSAQDLAKVTKLMLNIALLGFHRIS